MTAPLLEVERVSLAFRVSRGLFVRPRLVPAVEEASFAIRPGRVLGLVGESGSGKSTLAKMVLQLLVPDAGRILLEGRPVAEIGRRALARVIQPVFQDPYSSLNPKHTLAQIIAMPLAAQGIGTRTDRRARAIEMMERVGLPRRLLFSYPNQLSGGQRQRVAIARALSLQPRLLVCDEPTSALDVSVQAQILDLFERLRTELGLTYLFISHNLAVVERVADEVAVMHRGRIVEYAPSRQVFDRPRHAYTRMLLASALPPVPGRQLPRIEPFEPVG